MFTVKKRTPEAGKKNVCANPRKKKEEVLEIGKKILRYATLDDEKSESPGFKRKPRGRKKKKLAKTGSSWSKRKKKQRKQKQSKNDRKVSGRGFHGGINENWANLRGRGEGGGKGGINIGSNWSAVQKRGEDRTKRLWLRKGGEGTRKKTLGGGKIEKIIKNIAKSREGTE